VIAGIGTDIVEVPRMADVLARYGERFARRVLAEAEWEGFRASPNRPTYLAGRFAAKEAFAKALGTGLRYPVSLGRICITNDALGKPNLTLDPVLEQYVMDRGITARHVTLSHERSVACAFVVLEGNPPA
jgi:holo-[acyl-carrier protein] synthase